MQEEESPEGWVSLGPIQAAPRLSFIRLKTEGALRLGTASLWLLVKPGPGDREEVSQAGWEGGVTHSSLPGSVTPQSLGISPKQPTGPVREKTAPAPPWPLSPPTSHHRHPQ